MCGRRDSGEALEGVVVAFGIGLLVSNDTVDSHSIMIGTPRTAGSAAGSKSSSVGVVISCAPAM